MGISRESKLRTGYTTGTCAAAAAKAATIALCTQVTVTSVQIQLPIGQVARLQIHACHYAPQQAFCSVIKDAGDDPDITHGAEIGATVSWSDAQDIEIDGGEGVGTVTKPGLGLEVGCAAINPVPRRMIADAVRDVMGTSQGVRVVISVLDGEILAQKTLNPRLGIVGGISILGTTGIVVPYSTSAYRASVAQALDVAAANGCDHVVLTTGGRSERFAQQLLPGLADEAFVQIGEFLGFALTQCSRRAIRKATFCGMIGKFSKVAMGALHLHVKNSQVDLPFLARIAAECGATDEVVSQIENANTARHASELASEHGLKTWHARICERAHQQCLAVVQGSFELECILVDFGGQVLARI